MKNLDVIEEHPATLDNLNGFSRTKIDGFTDYWSYSKMKQMKLSPGHFKMVYIDGDKKDPTPAMVWGKLIHRALLETGEFKRRYLVKPNKADYPDLLDTADDLKGALKDLGVKTTGKKSELAARLLDFEPEAEIWINILDKFDEIITEDSIVVDHGEATRIVEMIAIIEAHPDAHKFITHGVSELFAYWEDKELGVTWLCVLDYVRLVQLRDGRKVCYVTELKTTQNAGPHAFQRDIAKFDYHLQNYIYRRVVRGILGCQVDLVQFAMETEKPYGIGLYEPDQRVEETASAQVRELLQTFKECMDNDHWPVHSERIIKLGLPNYIYWQIEEDADRELNDTE